MAAVVNTVCGRVPTGDLGLVLPHEHLLWSQVGCELDVVGQLSMDEKLASMTSALTRARLSGVTTVVDPTPAEMGRDVALMAMASRETGVHVVAATGVYCRHPTPYFTQLTSEELACFFRAELRDGIGDTGIKPGIVKVAINSGEFTSHESNALDAAAIVHHEFDVPIMAHAEPGAGLPVLRRLVDERGVRGSAIQIAHAEGVLDLDYQLETINRYGAYVGFDRFGMLFNHVRDELRLGMVTALCALGHAGSIHLAHDSAAASAGRGGAILADRQAAWPDWRVDHVPARILPRLREMGVREQDLHAMTHESPARWLAGSVA